MPTTNLNEVQKQRLAQLSRIRELNLDPYPQPDLSGKNSVSQALSATAKKVIVAGRLMSLRGHGNILFADLHDRTGKIQLFFEKKTLLDKMSLTKLLDLGDIISASGEVFTTQAGEITIRVLEFQILAKNIRPLPEKWHGLKDVEERYRQRYVDLIVNPEVKKVFETRTKILSAMRRFLDEHGFMEVETPILQPIYGGASAKPFVTHHNTLDMDMYLRISNELYLKRLIVGGLEKVYEVAKDFRNEGVSRFHNPEFTQIEFYWAYVDYDVLMKFTQDLVSYVLQNVTGSSIVKYQGETLDFTPPYKKLTFRDAIFEKTKIDIDKISTEDQFHQAITDKKITLDMDGVVGIGGLFDTLYKQEVRPYIKGPTFLTDYPSSMIALAKRKAGNPGKIASFQLLAQGTELLKAYNELNDPQDQFDRWREEEALSKKGAETAMQMDHDYIRALEYGMPPTAGWGMGIDRFTQFVTDQPTIKDVILFPAMRSEAPDTTPSVKDTTGRVVIGQVLSIDQHPNADKLIVCRVDIGSQKPLQIITGVRNFEVDDMVAVALPGAIVPTQGGGTQKIKKTKLRGELTEAMMCSPFELGVGEDHSQIHVLDPSLSGHLGEPLSQHI